MILFVLSYHHILAKVVLGAEVPELLLASACKAEFKSALKAGKL
jgi:hypothetical protein